MRTNQKITNEKLVISHWGNSVITEYSKKFISITTFRSTKEAKREFNKHRQSNKIIGK